MNSTSFAALSDPLQVRCPLSDGDLSAEKRKRLEVTTDDTVQAQGVLAPTITPFKAFGDSTPSSSLLPPLQRESCGSNVPSKRNSVSRQGSQHVQNKSRAGSQGQESSDSIQVLTARLDALRTQLQELQTQDDDEEAEFQASQAELIEQRDDLKHQLKERDDQNKDLNKSVKNLEHLNSAAQSKKTQQEKALNDKLRSRQKMHEDTLRWDSEMDGLHAEAEDLKKQQENLIAETKKRVAKIKRDQKPSLEALATIDEQIKQKGKEVQELDKERRTLDDAPDQAETTERSRAMAVEERELTERIAGLQAALHDASAAVMEFKGYIQQYESMDTGRRNSLQNGYVPAAPIGFESAVQEVNFSQPQQGTRVNFEVPETRPSHAYSHTRNETSSTGSFRTASPFHSQASNITLPSRVVNGSTSPDLAMEMLTGGALASPSAGALLPSDLLGDDADDMIKPRLRGLSNSMSNHSSNSRPASGMSRPMSTHVGRGSTQSGLDNDALPGLGTGLGEEEVLNGPGSPGASHDSASPSTFSSPHGSFANLHNHKLSDTNTENDRRSIRSASGSNRIIPSSWRFSAFGRQRGSTTSRDELPALGSLKSNQSQSMPRETDSLPGLGRKPASGIFGFGLGRRGAADAPMDFGAIGTPLRNTGSRPESTYSMEVNSTLPEPSANSPRFGWDVRRSSSTRTGGRRANPWSPIASRRQSVQQDPSGHLPQVEDNEDEDEDDNIDLQENVPMGSKSGRGKASDKSTQLNPNARDFTSMFGFGKRADKSDKVGSKSKKRDKTPRLDDPDTNGDFPYDSSPADSRKSKDTQSISFTDSFEDITEDADHDQELATPLAAGHRGSLMRIITNKGSGGKFLGLKTKKAAVLTDEGEDDSGSSKLGQSVESINSPTTTATPDKRSSTSSFFSSIGRRKKKGNGAPSVSEASLASETGDEDDLRPSMDGGAST